MDTTDVWGIDHVQLLCPVGGEATARSFWTSIVGLVEVAKPAALRDSGGVWFRCGHQGLHIGADPAFTPSVRAHPAIRLRSASAYAELVGRLEAAGIDIEHAKVPVADERMKVRDPFGNLIEFVLGTTG